MNVVTSADVHSGILSGVPSQAGFFQFKVCVADLGRTPVCSPANVTVNEPPKANLTVVASGTGTGGVTMLPQGVPCGASCQSFPVGTQVTLTAAPASGSTFAGWSGGNCTGTSPCAVALGANTTVGAAFASSGSTAVSTVLKPNTLALFTVSSGGSSSNFLGYDSGGNSLVVDSTLYYYSMLVPSTSQWVVLDQHTSVSYAKSSISPFVQDDRVFQVTDFGSGRTDIAELNLQTNKLGTQHMVGDAIVGSLSLVGDRLFYRSKIVDDLFGVRGGQLKVMSTWQFGGTTTTLLQRTDPDNQATYNIGDSGNVYAIRHDRSTTNPGLVIHKRDLATGRLSTLVRNLLIPRADASAYGSIWSIEGEQGDPVRASQEELGRQRRNPHHRPQRPERVATPEPAQDLHDRRWRVHRHRFAVGRRRRPPRIRRQPARSVDRKAQSSARPGVRIDDRARPRRQHLGLRDFRAVQELISAPASRLAAGVSSPGEFAALHQSG